VQKHSANVVAMRVDRGASSVAVAFILFGSLCSGRGPFLPHWGANRKSFGENP
jgi:hypothetical protein